ncbi:MAG: DUF4468 domain-containing protein [Bacteroidota bacterium]
MEKLISFPVLVIFLFAGISVSSQNIKNKKPPLTLYTAESGSYIYDTVINVKDVSKQDLYKRAKNWVISTVRTSDNTVVFDDSGFNEIRTDVTIGISLYIGVAQVNFKLSIYLKDNKCRLLCESFMLHYVGSRIYDSPLETAKFIDIKKVNKGFDQQFTVLTNAFIKSVLENKKSDW